MNAEWKTMSSDAKRELVKTYADGDMSARAIADIIGVSRNAIIGVVFRSKGAVKLSGWATPAPPTTKPQRQRKPKARRLREPRPTPIRLHPLRGGGDMSEQINQSPVWAPLPGSAPVSLMERTGCAFPVIVDGKNLFCNCTPAEGSPYCATHGDVMRKPKP